AAQEAIGLRRRLKRCADLLESRRAFAGHRAAVHVALAGMRAVAVLQLRQADDVPVCTEEPPLLLLEHAVKTKARTPTRERTLMCALSPNSTTACTTRGAAHSLT